MEEVWSSGRPPATPQSTWPQYTKHTQWPGDGPNKGKMGDPIFDYYAKTDSQTPTGSDLETIAADDIEQLLDLIGQPVILLLHSGVAPSGWMVADARPKLVKGIVAAEPVSPPIEEAERGRSGPGRLWGLTNLPVHYDPPIKEASVKKPPNCGPFARRRQMARASSHAGFRRSLRTSLRPCRASRSSMCQGRRAITVRTPIAQPSG